MGEIPPTSRFRIRLGEGDELPISSVEALARRVARGDVEPQTQLFDASTGSWQSASEASVVRFILDEMSRDGVELPPGWELASELDVEPEDRAVRGHDVASTLETLSESEPAEPLEPTELDPTEPDPLDLRLTLALPELPAERGEKAAQAPEVEPRAEAGSSPAPPREWLTKRSDGGLLLPPPDDGPETPLEESSAADRRLPVGGSRWRPGAGGTWMWLAGGSVVAIVLLISSFRARSVEDVPESRGRPELASDLPLGDPDAIPEGLELEVQESVALTTERYREGMDALWAEQGLSRSPPGNWLSGNYLANAAEFPQVAQFWNGYGVLLGEARASDESIFLAALAEAVGGSSASDAETTLIEAHLRARYAAAAPERLERYRGLASVTVAALELHAFLEDRTDLLEYTPALGTGTPAGDLILEVQTGDPVVRRELDLRLAAFVQALDRSRGGAAPPTSGLGEALTWGLTPF